MLYWVKFKVDQLDHRSWVIGQSKFELKQNLYIILYLEKSFETICGWFGRFYWRSYSKFCWGSDDSTATRRRIHNGWLSGTFWLYWNIIFYKKKLFENLFFDLIHFLLYFFWWKVWVIFTSEKFRFPISFEYLLIYIALSQVQIFFVLKICVFNQFNVVTSRKSEYDPESIECVK